MEPSRRHNSTMAKWILTWGTEMKPREEENRRATPPPHQRRQSLNANTVGKDGDDGARGRRSQQERATAYKYGGFHEEWACTKVSWFPRKLAWAAISAPKSLAQGRSKTNLGETNPECVFPGAGEEDL
jgi:hypothetical protein